ncbi:MAG: hypothetical protein IJI20_06840 [Firmicutes bacterium]|nr:hypothetical protein [Bacillota bacterium]
MTLLITIFAAVAATLIWYTKPGLRDLKIGVLCWMFWGASLMWTIDAVFEFSELKADYFAPAGSDMLNDAFLGFSVVALALIIWTVIVLVSDPRGTVKAALTRR